MFARRILLFIPHPDDEVAGCCATIGRARAQGCEVIGAYLTTGVPAAEQLWPWERKNHIARVTRRREEARRAAELLQIHPALIQDVPTRQFKKSLQPAHERLRELILEQKCEVVWTPAYEGGHQDHDAANFLASTLQDVATVWEFSEYNYFEGRVRSQEFPFANGTEHEVPLENAERQRKQQALAIYESERGNLRYIRTRREVFRPLAGYDYSKPPHPGKLFYQRFQWVPRHPRVDYCKPEEVCEAFRCFGIPRK